MKNLINNLTTKEKCLLPFNSIYWERAKKNNEAKINQTVKFHKSSVNYRKQFYKINFKDY